MAKPLRPKRGTTAKNDAFVGLASEITVDTEKHSIRVHDGVTAGGHALATEADLATVRDEAQASASAAQASASAAQATAEAALPKIGGTMTGAISYTGTVFAKKSNNSGTLVLLGGGDWDNGSYLQLCGSENSSSPSEFLLQSRLNGNNISFRGTNSGSLTWGAGDVSVVSSYTHGDTGCIRYSNGLQICWGDVTATTSGKDVTYTQPFLTPWSRILISQTAGNGTAIKTVSYVGSISKTATGFKALASSDAYCDWIAIGRWK